MTASTVPTGTAIASVEPIDSPIGRVIARMQRLLDGIPADQPHRRYFARTYLRTTRAVGDAVDQALFEDPAWVERWDVAFADLYLDAADDRSEPRTVNSARAVPPIGCSPR